MPATTFQNIEAIFFDMNGTLRVREPHEPTQRAAIERMLEILEKTAAPDAYWEELYRRQKAYRNWAQENLASLSEKEIWTQWMLPDYPPGKIEPAASELTLVWSERKGRAVPMPGAQETLAELKRRGYRLGVISNSMSTLDIPRSIQAFGWEEYFEVVLLSSELKSRKPAPGLFAEAARRMKVQPARCAYLGNRVSKDVVGAKRAGFALAMILVTPGTPTVEEPDEEIEPDAAIHSLRQMLDFFPEK